MGFLALLLMVFGQVDLPLAPASQFGPAGSIVTINLQAQATTPQSVAAIDAILTWNPAELQFIGPVPGTYAWFLAGFFPDPDGINANVTDGAALYTMLSPVATPLTVPPNIVAAGFQFKILTGGHVGLAPSMGTFGKTRVISSTPGVEITGTIGGPVCVGIPGSWTLLGGGIAGTFGIPPLLTGSGPQACQANTNLSLTGALPNTITYMPVGLSTLNLPLKGGVLIPSLDLILILVTSPSGDIILNAPWPDGIPAGLSIYYQCWQHDPLAVKNWAASNGLRSTTGI